MLNKPSQGNKEKKDNSKVGINNRENNINKIQIKFLLEIWTFRLAKKNYKASFLNVETLNKSRLDQMLKVTQKGMLTLNSKIYKVLKMLFKEMGRI